MVFVHAARLRVLLDELHMPKKPIILIRSRHSIGLSSQRGFGARAGIGLRIPLTYAATRIRADASYGRAKARQEVRRTTGYKRCVDRGIKDASIDRRDFCSPSTRRLSRCRRIFCSPSTRRFPPVPIPVDAMRRRLAPADISQHPRANVSPDVRISHPRMSCFFETRLPLSASPRGPASLRPPHAKPRHLSTERVSQNHR